MTPQHWMLTDVGAVREHNEDAYLWLGPEQIEAEAWLWAVCDGMGGETAGELAAATVVQSLREVFPIALRRSGNPHHALREAFEAANRRLLTMQEQNSALHKMGTTAAALCLFRNQVWVASVGDSRVYALHDGTLDQLTTDQTKLERMIEMGILRREEAHNHPAGNVLLSALGRSSMEINTCGDRTFPAEGNVFMLCSDGLSSFVEPTVLREALDRLGARDACEALVECAKVGQSDDNISCGVVRFAELNAQRATSSAAFVHWATRDRNHRAAAPPTLRPDELRNIRNQRDTPPLTSLRFDPRERWRDHNTSARPVIKAKPAPGRTVSFSPDDAAELQQQTKRPSSITARGGLRPGATDSLSSARSHTAKHTPAKITRNTPAAAAPQTEFQASSGPAAKLPTTARTEPEGVATAGAGAGGFVASSPGPQSASEQPGADTPGAATRNDETPTSRGARHARARGLHISNSQAQRIRDNSTRYLDEPMQSAEAQALGLKSNASDARTFPEDDEPPKRGLAEGNRLLYVLLGALSLLLVLLVIATLKLKGGDDESEQVATEAGEDESAEEAAEGGESGEEAAAASAPATTTPEAQAAAIRFERAPLPEWQGPAAGRDPDRTWPDDNMPAYLVAEGDLYIDAHEVTVEQLRAAIQRNDELRALHREVDAPRYRGLPCSSGTSTDDNDEREPACVSAESAGLYCRLQGRRLPTREDWRQLRSDERDLIAAGYGVLFDNGAAGPPAPIPATVNGLFGVNDGLPEALQPSELDLARGDLALLGGDGGENLPIVVRAGLRTQLLSGALSPAAVPMIGFRCVLDREDAPAQPRDSGHSERSGSSRDIGSARTSRTTDLAPRRESEPTPDERSQRIHSVTPRWEQVPAPRGDTPPDDESSLIFERIRSQVDEP